ncbi:MAG: hypothetical protein JXK95_10325 [Bacteroidales bacterium]|nr:hypothetical protein [Bacteroidales bacterium]
MKLLKTIIIFPAVLSFVLPAMGQTVSKYDLLTERYVDRPVAMHKGQFQFSSGYEFSIINAKYDRNGKKIDLAFDGSASAKQMMPFYIKFGVLDYLQLVISTQYANMGIRSQNRKLVGFERVMNVSELNQYRGMNDLFLGIDLTAPVKWHPVNWLINAGISLPVFGSEPGKPDHTCTIIDNETVALDYKYNNTFSTGVPVAFLGSSLKIRTQYISFTGIFLYSTGIRYGISYDWNFRLVSNTFEYEKTQYEFNYGYTLDYYGELAAQAIKWFTVRLALSNFSHHGGWSNLTGKKVSSPEKSLVNVSLGYEILVSPALRIEQHMLLPVAGKNLISQMTFLTGFSINLFAYQ